MINYAGNSNVLICIVTLLLATSSYCQSNWRPYLGIHASGDAELFYNGPSFQLGTDFILNKSYTVTGYAHYLGKQVDNKHPDGSFEKGKYSSVTAAILLESRLGKTQNKGSFLAGGLAFQSLKDDFSSNFATWKRNRSIIVPAIRAGYTLPINMHKLTIELNATGPSSYIVEENGFTHNILEILTQLSVGCRFVF